MAFEVLTDIKAILINAGDWANRPATPADGQRYYDVGRGIDFVWAGTLWLSTQRFDGLISDLFNLGSGVFSASSGTTHRGAFPEYSGSIYVERFVMSVAQAATYNSTNYWTLDFAVSDDGTTFTSLGSGSNWFTGALPDKLYKSTKSVGAQYNSTTGARFRCGLTKVGSAGALTIHTPILMKYRIVG
jgi:hypothetical protein